MYYQHGSTQKKGQTDRKVVETMAAHDRKHPATNVHRFLDQISTEDRQEFESWAKNKNGREILARLDELRDEYADRLALPRVSLNSCYNWHAQQYPRGDRAAAVMDLASNYYGVRSDVMTCVEMSIACTALNLSRVQQLLADLDAAESEFSESLSPDQKLEFFMKSLPARSNLLYNAHNLAKELGTRAIALHEARTLERQRELELAGGYRLAEILTAQATTIGNEKVIKELLRASLEQLEREARS